MRIKYVSLLAAVVLALAFMQGLGGCSRSQPSEQTKTMRAEKTFGAGLRCEANNAPKQAMREYRQTLKTDPQHHGALRRLATIYTDDQAFAKAIPLWKRYVSATNGSAEAYNDLGYCYDMAGYADPAEAAYLHGIEAEPSNRRLRTNYGLMLARHGRTNEALLHLRAAMPAADAHYNLAVILEDRGEVQAAKREYRRALKLDPNFADAELRMAAIE